MSKTEAYKLGFKDGYEEGVEDNPYTHPCLKGCNHKNQGKQVNYWDYREGYDEGVGVYCNEEEIKDTEEFLNHEVNKGVVK